MDLELIEIQIGLDVATNTTGFAAFINGDLKYFGDIETSKGKPYSGEKIIDDITTINQNALAFVGEFRRTHLDAEKKYKLDCIIALESSNHANASLGQKLATYIGIYCSAFTNALKIAFPDNKIQLKLINPREWNLRAFGEVLDRKTGKSTSIERAKKYLQVQKDISDDTADAINIASLAKVLRDNLIVGQERRERANRTIQNKSKILSIKIKLNDLKATLKEKQLKKNAKDKALIQIANKKERERILRYEAELKRLDADLHDIRAFHIIGETE